MRCRAFQWPSPERLHPPTILGTSPARSDLPGAGVWWVRWFHAFTWARLFIPLMIRTVAIAHLHSQRHRRTFCQSGSNTEGLSRVATLRDLFPDAPYESEANNHVCGAHEVQISRGTDALPCCDPCVLVETNEHDLARPSIHEGPYGSWLGVAACVGITTFDAWGLVSIRKSHRFGPVGPACSVIHRIVGYHRAIDVILAVPVKFTVLRAIPEPVSIDRTVVGVNPKMPYCRVDPYSVIETLSNETVHLMAEDVTVDWRCELDPDVGSAVSRIGLSGDEYAKEPIVVALRYFDCRERIR